MFGIDVACDEARNDIFLNCFRTTARDDNLVTPMALPYFEGDFWPNVIEDCIREVQNEELERKRLEEAARQEQLNAEDEDGDDVVHDGDSGKTKKNRSMNGNRVKFDFSKKKNNLKKGSSKNKKKVCSQTGNEVTDKLYVNFEKHKEVFFTIRLMSPQSELSAQNNEIKDPDPLIPSDLMDGRDTFLTRARDEHWEFSSLRLGSDMMKIRFSHSVICNTSDLFVVRLNLRLQRCIQSLVHACQCRDANCRRSTCHKMKRVVQHTKVPFCLNIRQKLQEQRRSQNRRADMMMRRRMDMLSSGYGGTNSTAPAQSTGQSLWSRCA
ncbi:unnamed protein product [Gongylonema pulchrum]|uniref:histone acetyltransferase n=1 Tax=Gongylonema pulchrum TaxID=637853 RepID=A0A183EJ23_9BILA|nr:unnamed protein product [Gongylonema pulchrum]